MSEDLNFAKVRVLNAEFARVTMSQTMDWIFAQCKKAEAAYIATVNVSIMMMMRDDTRLQGFVDNSGLTVCDGAPIVWTTNLRGEGLPDRVTGVDIIDPLCTRASEEGVGVYFLGATQETIEGVVENVSKRFPNLTISGYRNGYYGPDDVDGIVEKVRESGAKILIVGMGVPRQDFFIEDNIDKFGVSVAIGVGGSFDVIAGNVQRAPVFMQKIGMEWFFRLIQEPRRLFWRYFSTNSRFIYLITVDSIKSMFGSKNIS